MEKIIEDKNKEIEDLKAKYQKLKKMQVKKLKAVNPYQMDEGEEEEDKSEEILATTSSLVKEIQEKQKQNEMKMHSNQTQIQQAILKNKIKRMQENYASNEEISKQTQDQTASKQQKFSLQIIQEPAKVSKTTAPPADSARDKHKEENDFSNSSLSQNEDEMREKQNYLILKQSLKAL